MKTSNLFTFLFVFTGLPMLGAERPILIINEDNDHYFKLDSTNMTVAALNAYVDELAKGPVTHLFLCPSGQRTSYDSKVWEPIWAGLNDPDQSGHTNNIWCVNAKKLFDQGIDPYQVWIARCRKDRISPWLTPRMNDTHYGHLTNYFRSTTFWKTRRDLWRVPGHAQGNDCAFDYSHREVYDYHLALIKELLDRYDVDGVELDWMRSWEHLTPGKAREQAPILTEFMRDTRAYANGVAKRRGHAIQIGVRVPSHPDAALGFGMDTETWAREGLVDLIVPCNFWSSSDFDLPFALWRERIRRASKKVRVIPGTDGGLSATRGGPQAMRLGLYRGWADAQAAQGAEGVYLFNVPYQPKPVRDAIYGEGFAPTALASRQRRYAVTYRDCVPANFPDGRQLPLALSGTNLSIRVLGGTRRPADRTFVVLGVDAAEGAAPAAGAVTLNGVAALRVTNVWKNAIGLYGRSKQAFRYEFPDTAFRTGANTVGITGTAGEKRNLIWCEILLSPPNPIGRTLRQLAQSTAAHPAELSVVFYGQSIVAERAWTDEIARRLQAAYPTARFTFANKAIGGSPADILEGLAEQDLYPHYPDLLFFHVYGDTNSYDSIVRRVRERTTADVVVWSSHIFQNPSRPSALDVEAAAKQATAERYGCLFIPLREIWRNELAVTGVCYTNYLRDGIHHNAAGCALYADLLWRGLELNRLAWREAARHFSAQEVGCLDNPRAGTIREVRLSEVRKAADGSYALDFEGNRVVAIMDGRGVTGAVAEVRLDGKPLGDERDEWAHSRVRSALVWRPALNRVGFLVPLVAEKWTLTALPGTDPNAVPVFFKLTGSVTGFDGEGCSTNRFVSKSGRVVLEPKDWRLPWTMRKGQNKEITPGYTIQWESYPLFSINCVAKPEGGAELLVQGCKNGPHTLTLQPLNKKPLGLKAFRAYAPAKFTRGPNRDH